jgi:hypothetical protein
LGDNKIEDELYDQEEKEEGDENEEDQEGFGRRSGPF